MKKINIITFAALAVFLVISCKNNLVSKTEQKAPVPVEWIDVGPDGSTISLVKATTKQLQAKALPEHAADKTLIYSSARGHIASIDNTGLITAKEVGGPVTITIKAKNGVQKEIKVTVTAEKVPVEDIELPSDLPASLTIGDVYKLTAKAKPDTATEKALTYTASNDNVQIAEDGTVTALKDGAVTITVTSKSLPPVTKTVTFTIKNRPQIKYESKQAVMAESAADTYTFELQTIDGKLDYEPCFTSSTLPWITGAPTISSRTDPDKDVISFTCLKNKTVWNRRAYIKFKDKKTNQYIKVKDADGKEKALEVKVTQKRNEHPVVRIRWVKGVEGPTDTEKEKIAILNNGNPTGQYYNTDYVFNWYETVNTKFFNTRKISATGVPGNIAPRDSSQCWAKTASNMLHWWYEQNQNYIEQYKTKKGITGTQTDAYQHFYTRGLPDEKEHEKSYLANLFRTKCANSEHGSYIENGLKWYIMGLKGFAKDKNYSPALFSDVFTQETTPIRTERAFSKEQFENLIKDALDTGKAVGINMEWGTRGHAITFWGAAFDEEDNIIAVYVVDNNFKENRIFTYGIHYLKDIYKNHDDEQDGNHPYVIKYNTGIVEKNQHIGFVITLDKGEAQWQEWLNNH